MKLTCRFLLTLLIVSMATLKIVNVYGRSAPSYNYSDQRSLLSEACYENRLEDVKKCIERGVDVNKYDEWGWTPLMWASYYLHYDIVLFLLENGADPNLRTTGKYSSLPEGSTALMMAAVNGNVSLVKLLLKHKADKKIVNKYGRTAISYARNADSEETCNALKD